MSQIELSLVSPIYGVENYIKRFLNSLIPNFSDKVEILLIDDGSKDNCGLIIDEFERQYKDHVRVVHKKNGGLSSARNAGLAIAKGEYVTFIDPDDYLAENFTQTILDTIRKYKYPDMIFFDFYNSCKDKLSLQTISKFKEGVIPKIPFLKEFAKDEALKSMVWQKIIKRNLYDGLYFDHNVRIAEDALLLTDLALRLKTIVYLKIPLYYWVDRADSLTHTPTLRDEIKTYLIFRDRYDKYKKIITDISPAGVIKHAYNLVRTSEITGHTDPSIIECTNFIKSELRNILFDNEIKVNDKKQCLFVYLGISKYYNRMKYR